MKKLIVLLLTAIVTLVTSGSLMSCDRGHQEPADSTISYAEFLKFSTYANPNFKNASDFVEYAKERADYGRFTYTVSILSDITIATIANTAIKTHSYVDWRYWLEEYDYHKDIYTEMDKVSRAQGTAVTTASTAPSDTVEYSSLQTANK